MPLWELRVGTGFCPSHRGVLPGTVPPGAIRPRAASMSSPGPLLSVHTYSLLEMDRAALQTQVPPASTLASPSPNLSAARGFPSLPGTRKCQPVVAEGHPPHLPPPGCGGGAEE